MTFSFVGLAPTITQEYIDEYNTLAADFQAKLTSLNSLITWDVFSFEFHMGSNLLGKDDELSEGMTEDEYYELIAKRVTVRATTRVNDERLIGFNQLSLELLKDADFDYWKHLACNIADAFATQILAGKGEDK